MSSCSDSRQQLTAHYHHELTALETQVLEQHLAECAACRAAWDSVQRAGKLLRKNVLVEPSARARKQLHDQISAALRDENLPEPAAPAPRVQWHVTATPTQPLPALDYQPNRALPAPAEKSTARNTGEVRRERPASVRPSGVVRPELIRLQRMMLWICILVSITGFALGAIVFWALQFPGTREAIMQRAQKLGADRRWSERNSALNQPEKTAASFLPALKLPAEAASTKKLWVLPHATQRTSEAFLALYRFEDIERIRQAGGDLDAFEKALAAADILSVDDGACTLPANFKGGATLEQILGREARVTVMALANRLEVWPEQKLKEHLSQPPRVQGTTLTDSDVIGLPPEKRE